jgi:hypothetical protein
MSPSLHGSYSYITSTTLRASLSPAKKSPTEIYLPVCITSLFGYDKYAFLEAGTALGGKEEEYGDASFTLFAFPKVPITFILWRGDDEFPPSMKALFDPSITGYLPLEDIVVIAKLAASRILKTAHKQHVDETDNDM